MLKKKRHFSHLPPHFSENIFLLSNFDGYIQFVLSQLLILGIFLNILSPLPLPSNLNRKCKAIEETSRRKLEKEKRKRGKQNNGKYIVIIKKMKLKLKAKNRGKKEENNILLPYYYDWTNVWIKRFTSPRQIKQPQHHPSVELQRNSNSTDLNPISNTIRIRRQLYAIPGVQAIANDSIPADSLSCPVRDRHNP